MAKLAIRLDSLGNITVPNAVAIPRIICDNFDAAIKKPTSLGLFKKPSITEFICI